ncbi:tyrosine/phenylalanine carboxypeptidase domain-containing protein [Cohaesibacter intestini]|uniref:tyrosine/phenylalanine carboxypeptidase domain-containing protein n=1 Tax=Cohaesibacter intestini TaxID=2211145 RepID=UPI000DEBAB4F|nr:tyrosine/phenylalanine carboxypeptidase domain-containing protein [Cohaesibacter intestini]
MQSLSLDAILAKIEAGDPFQAREQEGCFELHFDPSMPYLCTAIHDGHSFSADLEAHCNLDEAERIYEEDPHTAELISALPTRIVGLDSRYEYDLNRAPDQAIYGTAWGKVVWKDSLPDVLVERSLAKHTRFYDMVAAVLSALSRRHGGCVVYDLHSYNGERRGGSAAPAFNIGTAQVDMRRHRASIQYLARQLEKSEVGTEPIRVGIDEVFEGRGYLASFCRAHSNLVLCVPLEVRKFFCDEKSGAAWPVMVQALKEELTRSITSHAAYAANKRSKIRQFLRHELLANGLSKRVRELDKTLYRIAGNLDPLLYINPVNLDSERKKFFARKGHYEPQFRYRHLDIDPFLVKEQLFRLPFEEIEDPTLQSLYRHAINSLSMKVDLMSVIGSKDCLYNSLRYYGEPDRFDMANAGFLIHAAIPDAERVKGRQLNDHQILAMIQDEVDYYQLDAKVLLSNRIIAGAMVENNRYRVLVRKGHTSSERAARALCHHEVGLHLVTAAIARRQPLELFRLGMSGSTEAQEGLAVLVEYLSGNLTMMRLKTLALRVIAVRCLLDGYSFVRTWQCLTEDHGAKPEQAFMVAVRVFRGGGFTKDFVYLRGLAKAAAHARSGKSWEPLLIGKGSFATYDRIDDLLKRGIAKSPTILPRALVNPMPTNPLHDYLISSLRSHESRPSETSVSPIVAFPPRETETMVAV